MPEPEKPKLPIPLSLIIGLAGLGTFGTLAYKSKLSCIAALIATVIWEAVVAITSKLWTRIEETIVKVIGDRFDILIHEMFAGYQKRYLEHLIHRHHSFDVKGLSTQGIYTLEIDQIYVELTIDPRELSKTSANPVPSTIAPGRHDILTYLQSPPMGNHNFAIIGAPGSGKTTLLKHVTLGLAGHRGPFRKVSRIPLLLFIRDHSEAIGESLSLTLAEIAAENAKKMGIDAPNGWFQRRLERGRCMVLLDGLDEVADAALRQRVANWVETQMQSYGKNRFLISSRPFGYRSNPLAGVTLLRSPAVQLGAGRSFCAQLVSRERDHERAERR
jgi:hypothetical protein